MPNTPTPNAAVPSFTGSFSKLAAEHDATVRARPPSFADMAAKQNAADERTRTDQERAVLDTRAKVGRNPFFKDGWGSGLTGQAGRALERAERERLHQPAPSHRPTPSAPSDSPASPAASAAVALPPPTPRTLVDAVAKDDAAPSTDHPTSPTPSDSPTPPTAQAAAPALTPRTLLDAVAENAARPVPSFAAAAARLHAERSIPR